MMRMVLLAPLTASWQMNGSCINLQGVILCDEGAQEVLMKTALFLAAAGSFLTVLAGCQQGGVHAVGVPSQAAQASSYDQVKALEGEWVLVKMNGETPPNKGVIIYKAASGGSSIREIMFPGSEHEMTNMYHMHGDKLMMTHYCGAGNQPRMQSVVAKPGHIELKTESVTNLATPKTEYMGELTLDMPDSKTLKQTWVSIEDGKPTSHVMVFELHRK
jgi:hypothetical protein